VHQQVLAKLSYSSSVVAVAAVEQVQTVLMAVLAVAEVL
jgi:hypothetical protein